MLTPGDGPDKPVPAGEDNSQIDDDFEYDYEPLKYTPPNDKLELEELFSSNQDRFEIGCATDFLVDVSSKTSNSLAQETIKHQIYI